MKEVGLAYATCSPDEQLALIEQANGLITDICNDHVFAAEAYIQDPSLKEFLARRIEAECQELIEYILAAKRFNLEINSRAKDRVISFGEKLACLYMTVLLQDVVRIFFLFFIFFFFAPTFPSYVSSDPYSSLISHVNMQAHFGL